jgi:hypothetical protein
MAKKTHTQMIGYRADGTIVEIIAWENGRKSAGMRRTWKATMKHYCARVSCEQVNLDDFTVPFSNRA